jgi:hypothetical protein
VRGDLNAGDDEDHEGSEMSSFGRLKKGLQGSPTPRLGWKSSAGNFDGDRDSIQERPPTAVALSSVEK